MQATAALEEFLEELHRGFENSGLSFDEVEDNIIRQRAIQTELQSVFLAAGLHHHWVKAGIWFAKSIELESFAAVADKLDGLADHLHLLPEEQERLEAVFASRWLPSAAAASNFSPPGHSLSETMFENRAKHGKTKIEKSAQDEVITVTVLGVVGNVLWGPATVVPSMLVCHLKAQILDDTGKNAELHKLMLLHGSHCMRDAEAVGESLETVITLTGVFSRDKWQGTVDKFEGSFGFVRNADIRKDHPLRDIFLHRSDCDGFRPKKGDEVYFHLILDEKRGFPKATDVTLQRAPRPGGRSTGVLQNQPRRFLSARLGQSDL